MNEYNIYIQCYIYIYIYIYTCLRLEKRFHVYKYKRLLYFVRCMCIMYTDNFWRQSIYLFHMCDSLLVYTFIGYFKYRLKVLFLGPQPAETASQTDTQTRKRLKKEIIIWGT